MNNPYTALIDTPEPWEHPAACASADPETWHPLPGDHETEAAAIRICGTCPAKQICLDAAMDEERHLSRTMRHGIRGGLTADERHEREHAVSVRKPGRCLRGHSHIDAYVSYGGKHKCRTCARELNTLRVRAAEVLGMSTKRYIAEYGAARSTAEAIIAEHERAA